MENHTYPEMETIEIKCDKENILDYMWLFNNIPWSNFDNKKALIKFDSTIKVFNIVLNGYDTKTAEIVEFEFDNVIIIASHGSAGNSFLFDFKLGEESVGSSYDEHSLAYSKEDVKNKYIKKIEAKIKGLNNQILYNLEAICKINTL